VYLDAVGTQSAHSPEAAAHDAVVGIDLLPCRTAAAAVVHVGNGARSRLFVDHLLLALNADAADGSWKIISKTFAPRAWPGAV